MAALKLAIIASTPPLGAGGEQSAKAADKGIGQHLWAAGTLSHLDSELEAKCLLDQASQPRPDAARPQGSGRHVSAPHVPR